MELMIIIIRYHWMIQSVRIWLTDSHTYWCVPHRTGRMTRLPICRCSSSREILWRLGEATPTVASTMWWEGVWVEMGVGCMEVIMLIFTHVGTWQSMCWSERTRSTSWPKLRWTSLRRGRIVTNIVSGQSKQNPQYVMYSEMYPLPSLTVAITWSMDHR